MQNWIIDKVTFCSTRRSAEVTMRNQNEGSDDHVTVQLSDISIHDGMEVIRHRALETLRRKRIS